MNYFEDKLKEHFEKFEYKYDIEYFYGSYFKAYHNHFEYMLENNIDPSQIDDWIRLEEIFTTPFEFIQAKNMVNELYKKYDIYMDDLDGILRNK